MPNEPVQCPNCGSGDVQQLAADSYACEYCRTNFRWTDHAKYEAGDTVTHEHNGARCDGCGVRLELGELRRDVYDRRLCARCRKRLQDEENAGRRPRLTDEEAAQKFADENGGQYPGWDPLNRMPRYNG